MLIRRMQPSPFDDVDTLDAYALPDTEGRPYLRVNMVSSLDGAAAVAGRVGSLSGLADQTLLHELRTMCDVLLVGAGTIRAEGYGPLRLGEDELQLRRERGQSEAPRLAVLSRHLDLDLGGAAFSGATARPILLTTEAVSPERRRAAERVADVVVAGRDAVNLARAVELLAEHGLPQILSEGGPHVLAGLFAADLVDELCLALAPLVIGGRELRITAGDLLGVPSEMELSDVLEKDGYLFLRYRVQR